MLFQVVEKDMGGDWHPVRYYDRALTRFETEKEATQAAVDYVTDRNCNNALAKDEKQAASEVFMVTKTGCFLGMLDKEPWYMLYPKDIISRKIEIGEPPKIEHTKGDVVADRTYFQLEGKTEVAVRTIPGS